MPACGSVVSDVIHGSRVRPRLCIASSGLGHVSRGIEAWAHDLGHALAQRGHDVTLCKGGGEATEKLEYVASCLQRGSAGTARLLKWLPKKGSWRLGLGSGPDIEQTTFAWSLLRLLRRRRIDLVHVQDPHVALLMQRASLLGLTKSRVILGHGTEESLAFQSKITFLQHLAPWHLEEARAVGVWKPTWTAIPNFIDVAQFSPGDTGGLRAELEIPSDAVVTLAAAAIKRGHKRIDWLIGEFAELRKRRPDLPLWLVVAGGREAETDELIAEGRRHLGDRVRFLVRFPRERMAELYRASDVFTLASLKEMMPIALLEATGCGLPCLVHPHPVMRWMIGPGGRTVDMTAPGALAGVLIELASDPSERARLGAAGRRHCVENFGKQRVVDQILEYYQFVLGHGGQRTKQLAKGRSNATLEGEYAA